MEQQLKVALFDFDGTLVDTEGQYTQFWGRMARTYRPDVPRLEYLINIFLTLHGRPKLRRAWTNGRLRWTIDLCLALRSSCLT